jgi:hypothetical protein
VTAMATQVMNGRGASVCTADTPYCLPAPWHCAIRDWQSGMCNPKCVNRNGQSETSISDCSLKPVQPLVRLKAFKNTHYQGGRHERKTYRFV